jgi:hypothetical protein
MNEVVSRLMNEAQIIDPQGGGVMHVKRENFQKFAELVVQECRQVSLKNSHRDDDMGAIIAQHINRHFGIQE